MRFVVHKVQTVQKPFAQVGPMRFKGRGPELSARPARGKSQTHKKHKMNLKKALLIGGTVAASTVSTFAAGTLPAAFTALSDDMLLVPAGLVAIGVAFIGAKAGIKVLGKVVSYLRG